MDISISKQLQDNEVASVMNVRELSHYIQLATEITRRKHLYQLSSILTYVGTGVVTVHFLPESQYPGKYR